MAGIQPDVISQKRKKAILFHASFHHLACTHFKMCCLIWVVSICLRTCRTSLSTDPLCAGAQCADVISKLICQGWPESNTIECNSSPTPNWFMFVLMHGSP